MINIFSLIFISVLVILFQFKKLDSFLLIFSIIIFFFKVVFIYFDNLYDLLPYKWDTLQFEETSSAIYLEFQQGNFFNLLGKVPTEGISGVFSFSYLSAFLYLFFGESYIIPRIFNALLGSLISLNIHKIAIRFLTKHQSNNLFIIFSILPSFLLFSSIFMRDSINTFLFTIIVLRVLIFLNKKTITNFIALILFISFSYLLRSLNPLLVLISISASTIFLIKKKDFRDFKKNILVLISISLTLFFLIGNNLDFGRDLRDYILNQLNYRASGGSNYLFIEVHNLTELLFISPWLYSNFLFYPFVFNVKDFFSFLFFIESLIYFIYFMVLIYNLFRLKNINLYKSKLTEFVFLFFLFFILSYLSSLLTANGGTALRHRMFIVYILPIVSLYLSNFHSIRKRISISYFQLFIG
jgi:hypothetical protein